MASFDFSPFAVGGATRPDSFTGLDPAFLGALEQLFSNAPPEIQQNLRVLSGFRSPERQEQLWQGALAKYGSPEAARKWVAPPGKSKHNHGQAVDLRYLDDSAQKWAHENAQKFGMHFPLSNEPWHIEPAGSRSGGHGHQAVAMNVNHAPQASGTPAPPMGPGIEVADRPIGVPQPAPAPATPPPAGEQGGIGALLASMAPMAAGQGAPGVPEPQFGGSADPMQATMAAMQGAEKAKGLSMGLMPDVAALMGLGGRKAAPKVVG